MNSFSHHPEFAEKSVRSVAAVYDRRGSRRGLRDGPAQSLRRLPTDDTVVVDYRYKTNP